MQVGIYYNDQKAHAVHRDSAALPLADRYLQLATSRGDMAILLVLRRPLAADRLAAPFAAALPLPPRPLGARTPTLASSIDGAAAAVAKATPPPSPPSPLDAAYSQARMAFLEAFHPFPGKDGGRNSVLLSNDTVEITFTGSKRVGVSVNGDTPAYVSNAEVRLPDELPYIV